MATAAELLNFAKQRHQAGDLPAADQLYRQVLEVEPARGEALALLALTYHQRNELEEAARWYERALAVQPGDAESHFRLGLVLMGLQRSNDALVHFQEAVRLRPDSPDTWNNLGNAYFLRGKAADAVRCYREAVRLRPDYAEGFLNLGNALREDDRTVEGLACYRESVRLRPNYAKSRINLAAALLETGDTVEGEAQLRKALELRPGAATVLSTLVANGLYTDADPGIEQLRARLADPQTPEGDAPHLHFTLGRLLDEARQYEEAFHHFKESNRIRRGLVAKSRDAFHADEHTRFVDRLIAYFTPERIAQYRHLGQETEEPIFVVGMPRSGSSLVEQILSNHPEIRGVGELRDFPRTVDGLPERLGSAEPYPECLSLLDRSMIRQLSEEYLTRIHDLVGPAPRITDKMLVNFLHLGLIAILFPRARVIHCRRNPVDTCVSAFMQLLRGLSFTLDLDDLGRYYRDYERLMAHWRVVRPLPMLEVVYEALVADVEAGSRQLVEFCGLAWDERCLRFYENPRAVRTVSKLQVRRPVYNSSVGRWKRYGTQLRPLLKALGLNDSGEPLQQPPP
jgi:tetratricopeptide (TPR) repeat protein